jgi:branched-chain amino acid transport system substrate-binding protein
VITTTGSFAAFSGYMLTASQVSATEFNTENHRYKINVVKIATDGTPSNTLQAVTRAVSTEHVGYVTGFLTSDVATAVSAAAPRLGVDVLDALAQDSVLVGKECNTNYFKVSADEDQYAKAFGLTVQKLGIKAFDAIAPGYARGYDAISGLKTVLNSDGGALKTTQYASLGTTDFGTQISKLSSSPAEALYVGEAGADAVAFAKQASQFGLFRKFKAVIGQGFLIPPIVSAMGSPVEGVYDFQRWLPNSTESGAQQFVKDYEAKTNGAAPWDSPAAENVVLQLLTVAADKAGTNDPAKVGSSMAGLSINSIQGPVQMRAQDHLLLQPLMTTQVQDVPNQVVRDTWTTQQTTPPVSPDCHM